MFALELSANWVNRVESFIGTVWNIYIVWNIIDILRNKFNFISTTFMSSFLPFFIITRCNTRIIWINIYFVNILTTEIFLWIFSRLENLVEINKNVGFWNWSCWELTIFFVMVDRIRLDVLVDFCEIWLSCCCGFPILY